MTYEQGFAQGEADAYRDRQAGVRTDWFGEPSNEFQRGYRDGYVPQSATWWLRAKEAVTA